MDDALSFVFETEVGEVESLDIVLERHDLSPRVCPVRRDLGQISNGVPF